MTLRGAAEALTGALAIRNGVQGEHRRNYYDTFDGLLHGAGLSLVHEHELGFMPAEEPLVDEAVRVAGGVPGGFSAKIDVPLRFEERADAAAAAVLRALLEVVEANLEGTIDDLDSEFLHDLRVSVRR